MKFNKLVATALSALSLLTVSPVSAFFGLWDGCGCNDLDLYGGIELGLGTFTGKGTLHRDPTLILDRHAQHGANSFVGGGLIGAKMDVWDCLWASLEADLFYDSLNENLYRDFDVTGASSFSYHLDRKFGYGLGLRIGMDLCNAYPYWMVGFEGGRWNQSLNNNSATNLFGIPAFSSVKAHKDTISPKVGLGAEFKWDCNIGLRIEYTYVFGPKLRNDLVIPAVVGVTPAIPVSHSLRVNEGKALIALIYHW